MRLLKRRSANCIRKLYFFKTRLDCFDVKTIYLIKKGILVEEQMKQGFERMLEQTAFLLEQQEKSKEHCESQFLQLLNFINTQIEAQRGGEDVKSYQEIADMINKHYQEFLEAVDEDVDFLKKQLAAVEAVQNCQDIEKQKELRTLLLEGEELIDTEQFKKEVLAEAEEAKKGFHEIIDDLKYALEEGNLDEVLVYLQEIEDIQEKELEGEEGEEEGKDLFEWVTRENEGSCDEKSCSSCGEKSTCCGEEEKEVEEDEKK